MSNYWIQMLKSRVRSIFPKPPYEYVQSELSVNLHKYLGRERGDIRKILIVGAYYGFEVDSIRKHYPSADITVFEASTRYYPKLNNRFSRQSRVTCVNKAVSNFDGKILFNETNLEGCGSVLVLSEAGARDYGMVAQEVEEVDAVRLDTYLDSVSTGNDYIDLLWCDVQGAEHLVLEGLGDKISNVGCCFLEVSVFEPTYQGACTMDELSEHMTKHGFALAGLGTDSLNGTGNGFWIRKL